MSRTCRFCDTILRSGNPGPACALHSKLVEEPDNWAEMTHVDGPKFAEWLDEYGEVSTEMHNIDTTWVRYLKAARDGRVLGIWTVDWMLRQIDRHLVELPAEVYCGPAKRTWTKPVPEARRLEILRETEGLNTIEAAEVAGVSSRTIANWRKQYAVVA